MTSRMQVARYVADGITSGNRMSVLTHAAAWLTSTGRKHEAGYLTKDVATILQEQGYAAVTVTTARPLTATSRAELVAYAKAVTGAQTIELHESVDASLIGGFRLTTPTAELDDTIQHRLQTFAKGVI